MERGGRELRDVAVTVEDLHQLTPSVFLEAAGAVLHGISFMQARNGNLKVRKVLISMVPVESFCSVPFRRQEKSFPFLLLLLLLHLHLPPPSLIKPQINCGSTLRSRASPSTPLASSTRW